MNKTLLNETELKNRSMGHELLERFRIKVCFYTVFCYWKLEIFNVLVENVLELQIPKCLIAANYYCVFKQVNFCPGGQICLHLHLQGGVRSISISIRDRSNP